MQYANEGIPVAGRSGAAAGAAPSGHHREGRLRFHPAGPADGTVTFRFAGFDVPVEATWTLGGAR